MDSPKTFVTIEEIEIGSVWHASDGSGHKVTVVLTHTIEDMKDSLVSENNWVTYSWEENGKIKTHKKSLFSFQVRYYLPK